MQGTELPTQVQVRLLDEAVALLATLGVQLDETMSNNDQLPRCWRAAYRRYLRRAAAFGLAVREERGSEEELPF